MKVSTIVLTLVFLGSVLATIGQSQVIPGQLVISSSDERSFVPEPATNTNVMISYPFGDPGGATSIRFEKNKIVDNNEYPPNSKTVYGDRSVYGDTYQERDRDLGQTFVTNAQGFTADAIYLRVGPNEVKRNTPGARVAIQFFKVTGQPRLNERGTPGFVGQFNRQTSPELDDYLEGESYTSIYYAIGQLPNNLKKNQYMKWSLKGKSLKLEPHTHYAFMIMFLDREEERTLSLYNNYYGSYRPHAENPYIGHSIRREGKPDFPDQWQERLTQEPGTVGFPDVCTFRDLFFVITGVPIANLQSSITR
ncbi:hypothetical protein ICL16_36095 [Iningainema sp. BLCCT55]|uniref:Uncharacterized protein n=1 Tax=Iningainema tapete BLCC-T55 TaxID=2748662 RepID=A0A8J7C8X2_9CYAN|nr:hypothetical protein [Iningainema tapete]MBD2777329.1 hypothetical protein [Iningainema tapete BLCC-T55]